ncbi:M23 family metallopeptidase [Pilimelia columellifera]|uniref:M23ase beta-sheet core domain-containing protein n=1 Tax=Pilimelia columellifera subsp. columellifera TaxID=706583 RepID=A0ABN3NER0_9ACTN
MRQRLSSEPDRYRGRRRVPTPPRSRYAVVVTGAVVGAGMVALGAGAMMPDAKAVNDTTLANIANTRSVAEQLAARSTEAEQASRGRSATGTSFAELESTDSWLLPLKGYRFTSPFGVLGGRMHPGIDLAAAEGTPITAMYDGTVVSASWMGGYGYTVVIDHGNGVEALYGHQDALQVTAGQQVKAGDQIGVVGSTGLAYQPQLYLEVQAQDEAIDPIPFLQAKGVDIQLELD